MKKHAIISLITLLFYLFGTYEVVSATVSIPQIQNSTHSSETEINKYRSGPSRYQPSTGFQKNPTKPAPSPSTPLSPGRGSGGFLSHLGAFGAGAFLGSMMHPFGGGFYGGYSFSLLGMILDLILIFIVFSLILRLFRRHSKL